tara:strand:+ start:317 stop:577 length:261 start_codon:yes stop_codon:yes gene_type:complete
MKKKETKMTKNNTVTIYNSIAAKKIKGIKLKTTGDGWINAYYENKLNDLPLGYIKKVESLFTDMNIKMSEPQESNRLDRGSKKRVK